METDPKKEHSKKPQEQTSRDGISPIRAYITECLERAGELEESTHRTLRSTIGHYDVQIEERALPEGTITSLILRRGPFRLDIEISERGWRMRFAPDGGSNTQPALVCKNGNGWKSGVITEKLKSIGEMLRFGSWTASPPTRIREEEEEIRLKLRQTVSEKRTNVREQERQREETLAAFLTL
mgnify:CR=1 FL=1